MKNISDYTEAEFIGFIERIQATNKRGSDAQLGELLAQFRTLTEHPEGTDLIFYPEPGEDSSAEGIAQTVKHWRQANSLPGFKQ
ncbi:bacteriocin immunity protein [Pseudomonas sp. COR58]|uniref:Bacteriocin immunity protein n=2 Tax=Pseudomonas ekonensis TaxID=2842353 RepID=A0ABS6P891_9PSED|nr:bacteriocin immunity protein [Pseudomonas ekonensis]MBV4456680.1 bacteriocin immunity protein [Pseudomonas ekonensis]